MVDHSLVVDHILEEHLVIYDSLWTPGVTDMRNFLLNFPWNDYCFQTNNLDMT